MLPYIILILIPLTIQHARLRNSSSLEIATSYAKFNGLAMKMFWLLLGVMLVFRHESIGNDTINYHNMFVIISKLNWSQVIARNAEVGYNLLNKLISLLTNDFRLVLLITSIISVIFIAKAYNKYSDDASLTISLFITMSNFVLLFSGIRQAIAISLGMLAYEATKNKKIFVFFAIVVVAMLFHTSAFMLLAMYPLYHVRITRKWLIAVIPLMIIVFIFNEQIFNSLGAILMLYTEYEVEIDETGSITMLILFIIFAMFSFVIPEEKELDNDTIAMRNFMLFSVMLQMFAPLHALAMRLNYYYIIFIPLLIPRIIKHRRARFEQIAIFLRHIMLAFFIIYFFITAPADNVLHTFPYRFMWQAV